VEFAGFICLEVGLFVEFAGFIFKRARLVAAGKKGVLYLSRGWARQSGLGLGWIR
jgi:hypothetical protein